MEEELFELAKDRIRELAGNETGDGHDGAAAPFDAYFQKVAGFLEILLELFSALQAGEDAGWDEDRWKEYHDRLYEDILPQNYDTSYANPAYATEIFGEGTGTFLAAVYTLMRGCIQDAYEERGERLLAHTQYFLELYSSFVCAAEGGIKVPPYEELRSGLRDFALYQYENEAELSVAAKIDPANDFALDIIKKAANGETGALYRYGEYIADDQIQTLKYLRALPEGQLKLMADTFTEGYRIGFDKTGKDLSIKGTVGIIFPIGFEPMVQLAIANFKEMGLQPVIRRDSRSAYDKRYGNEAGYYGGNPNRQYEYDHREDIALFMDKMVLKRRLDCMTNAYEKRKHIARQMAGPAVIERFGEALFQPVNKAQAAAMSPTQHELSAWYDGQQGEMIVRYIPENERSFTIIAFPIPQIGEDFDRIMQETIRLNTLDANHYEEIQQQMIDALDTCEMVCIRGQDGNRTDLKIRLCELEDPAGQSKFENCVADVNIPVGEVFTSPKLTGTKGLLHVKKVFLNGLEYRDLYLEFEDGRVTDYGCGNFEDPAEGSKLIEAQILYHHKNLPMGEFAIGTNTVAYMMGRRFGIEDKMPILIAEKTGPHMAVGDTCYSHAEDIRVYNPDGKEIIARDNEVSQKRRSEDETERAGAYYHCHTDITIPYDELGELYGVQKNGTKVPVIEKGRFVLPAALELNRALDGE